MGINAYEKQALFNFKVKQGKSEALADKEIKRDVDWLNKLEEKKKELTKEVRILEQRKITLQLTINHLLKRERELQ